MYKNSHKVFSFHSFSLSCTESISGSYLKVFILENLMSHDTTLSIHLHPAERQRGERNTERGQRGRQMHTKTGMGCIERSGMYSIRPPDGTKVKPIAICSTVTRCESVFRHNKKRSMKSSRCTRSASLHSGSLNSRALIEHQPQLIAGKRDV